MLPNQSRQSVALKHETRAISKAENRETIVLSVLSDHHSHSRAEIEKALGVSTSTTRRILQNLMDQGKITANDGTRKNAVYAIAEKE